MRLGTQIAETLSKGISLRILVSSGKVLSSTSIKKGTKSLQTKGATVVENVSAGVITFDCFGSCKP